MRIHTGRVYAGRKNWEDDIPSRRCSQDAGNDEIMGVDDSNSGDEFNNSVVKLSSRVFCLIFRAGYEMGAVG